MNSVALATGAVDNRAYPIGPNAAELVVARDGSDLRVIGGGETLLRLSFDAGRACIALRPLSDDRRRSVCALSAAVEALFGWNSELSALHIEGLADSELEAKLIDWGLAVSDDQGLRVLPEMAMQLRCNWMPDPDRPSYPQRFVMSNGCRHPRRPAKPRGAVYERYIPWLETSVSFRALDAEHDLQRFHAWMNDPRVDAFWDEAGSLEKHRAYLAKLAADPHMLTLIGCFGGVPFGYFEIYWAKENRIAPFYDANDYDRGWHVLVGEDAFRGRDYISAWLPSLMHYMFLDDCRTQRIVGEPAAAHHQQIRNLERSGFSKVKNFDFPHKRATLVMLLRERFFNDRLWLPASSTSNFVA